MPNEGYYFQFEKGLACIIMEKGLALMGKTFNISSADMEIELPIPHFHITSTGENLALLPNFSMSTMNYSNLQHKDTDPYSRDEDEF